MLKDRSPIQQGMIDLDEGTALLSAHGVVNAASSRPGVLLASHGAAVGVALVARAGRTAGRI